MTATLPGPAGANPASTPALDRSAPPKAGPGGPDSGSDASHALLANRNRIVDGFRGLAAISVVLGHTVLINQLIFSTTPRNIIFSFFDCLPFFFAVSGVMNYRRFVLGALSGKLPRRGALVSNRLWRIVPVYFFICLVVWAMRFANSPADWSDLALHLSFMQVWSPTYVFWLDGPSWFLADDLQFFLLTVLLAPIVTQLALRITLNRGRTLMRMAVMFAFPLVLFAIGCADIWWVRLHDHNTSEFVRYTPLYTVPEYAAGMMLAVVMFAPGVIKIRRAMGLLLMLGGLAGVGVVNYFQWHGLWANAYDYPLVAIGFCILVAGAFMVPPDALISRLLGIKPLQFLATVGLTILLVQEPLEITLEKLGFVNSFDPTACWVSALLLTLVSAAVAWVALHAVENPALLLRDKIRKVNSMEIGRDRRHHGPIPRVLPDVTVALPSGEQVPLRSALGSRPLLLAFGEAGAGALAEQRFRIDAGESDALHISPSFDRSSTESERLGARIAFDPDDTLAQALNVPVALVEVDPDGSITSFQRSRRESLGAWA